MKNWKQIYGWAAKCWTAGYGLIIARIYGIINLSLLASTYLIVKGFNFSFTETLIIGFIGVVGIFLSGVFAVKAGLLKAEASSNFHENPQSVEMYERLQRIEAKLDKLEKVFDCE